MIVCCHWSSRCSPNWQSPLCEALIFCMLNLVEMIAVRLLLRVCLKAAAKFPSLVTLALNVTESLNLQLPPKVRLLVTCLAVGQVTKAQIQTLSLTCCQKESSKVSRASAFEECLSTSSYISLTIQRAMLQPKDLLFWKFIPVSKPTPRPFLPKLLQSLAMGPSATVTVALHRSPKNSQEAFPAIRFLAQLVSYCALSLSLQFSLLQYGWTSAMQRRSPSLFPFSVSFQSTFASEVNFFSFCSQSSLKEVLKAFSPGCEVMPALAVADVELSFEINLLDITL